MSKPLTIFACGDSHGDMEDSVTSKALFRSIKDVQPDVVIHAGDVFDARPLRGKASAHEKAASMDEDLRMGYAFLDKLFRYGKEKVLLLGNHDQRIFDLRHSPEGILRDKAEDEVRKLLQFCRQRGIKVKPYTVREGIYTRHGMSWIHGFGANSRHGALYLSRYETHVQYAHHHNLQTWVAGRHSRRLFAWGIGAVARTEMEYNERQFGHLDHESGWTITSLFPSGAHQVMQARRFGDAFYAAAQIKTY